jgi:hypothetical protein
VCDFRRSKCLSFVLLDFVSVAILVTPIPHTSAAQPASLLIETVPPLEGMPFLLGGQRFVTDENGVVEIIPPEPGTYDVSTKDHVLLDDQRRASFAAWSDGVVEPIRAVDIQESVRLEVGFDVDHLVTESFRAVDGEVLSPESIESIVVVDDRGRSTTFRGPSRGVAGPTAQEWERFPPGTRWLRAVRVTVGDDGLRTEQASYNVESVRVNGERAPGSPDDFAPQPGAEWVITMELPAAAGRWVWAIVVIAALSVGVLGLLAVIRIRRQPQPLLARLPFLHRGRARREGDVRDSGREFVRVTLRNGRKVEGWRTNVSGDEALAIQVTSVQGPGGEKVESDSVDYWFLLPSQVDRIETLQRAGDRKR